MADRFNEDFLIASSQYAETIENDVLPFLRARETRTTLSGAGGVPLACVSWAADRPAGTVLILHGFTENTFKYSELIHSLLRCGFSVVMYDQRGHGLSGRDPAVRGTSVTHVDAFTDYVADAETVCDTLLSPLPGPRLLLAHSMGGAVGALLLEKRPDFFAGAALCSPMIAPDRAGLPASVTLGLCRGAILLGRRKHHPFFMKAYAGPEDFASSCATDPVRFAWYDAVKAARKEYQNATPSYGWIRESVLVTKKILAHGEPEKIACPVLLSAAEHDGNVLPEPQEAFIARVLKGRRVLVKGAKHEIFRSVNDILFPWWHQVLAFLRDCAAQ